MSQSVLVESPIDKLNYSNNITNDKLQSILSEEYRSQGNFISVFIHEEEDDEDENIGPLYVSVNNDMYGFEFKQETPEFTKYYYKCEFGNSKSNNVNYFHTDYVEIKVKKGDKVDVEIKNYSLIQISNGPRGENDSEDGLEEYIFTYTEEGVYIEDGVSSDNNIKLFYPKSSNILPEYEMVVEIGDLP